MNQLLDELMKNAENNTHLVVFELDQTKELKVVAPFDMRISREIGTAFVNAKRVFDEGFFSICVPVTI